MDKDAENKGAERPDDARESSKSGFLEDLHRFFQSHELQAFFRVTADGLFIHEDAIDRLLHSYQQWLKEKTGSQTEKTIEKCRRRLFDADALKLFYLLDGKRVLPGFLLRAAGLDYRKIKVAFYGANLMDTAEYIHPRDPILERMPDVRSEMDPREGLLFIIPVLGKELRASTAALGRFAKAARANNRITEQHPVLLGPLRSIVPVLPQIFKQARLVSHKERLLIPLRSPQKLAAELRLGQLVLLIGEGGVLLETYGTAGKSLHLFWQEQFPALLADRQKPQGIELTQKANGPFAGKIFVQKTAYLLEQRVMLQFLAFLPRASMSRKVLDFRFTIREGIETFILFFTSAKPIADNKRRERPQPQKGRIKPPPKKKERDDLKYRRSGVWLFGFDQKNVIRLCSFRPERRGEKKEGR